MTTLIKNLETLMLVLSFANFDYHVRQYTCPFEKDMYVLVLYSNKDECSRESFQKLFKALHWKLGAKYHISNEYCDTISIAVTKKQADDIYGIALS